MIENFQNIAQSLLTNKKISNYCNPVCTTNRKAKHTQKLKFFYQGKKFIKYIFKC